MTRSDRPARWSCRCPLLRRWPAERTVRSRCDGGRPGRPGPSVRRRSPTSHEIDRLGVDHVSQFVPRRLTQSDDGGGLAGLAHDRPPAVAVRRAQSVEVAVPAVLECRPAPAERLGPRNARKGPGLDSVDDVRHDLAEPTEQRAVKRAEEGVLCPAAGQEPVPRRGSGRPSRGTPGPPGHRSAAGAWCPRRPGPPAGHRVPPGGPSCSR